MPYGTFSPIQTSANPTFRSFVAKARSARAPDTHPAHAASLVMISGGRSSSTVRSETHIRPPGRRTPDGSRRPPRRPRTGTGRGSPTTSEPPQSTRSSCRCWSRPALRAEQIRLGRVGPHLALEELPSSVKAGEHGPDRRGEQTRDLLRCVPLDVSEHEGHAVDLGESVEHRPDVLRTERAEEVEVERVRVGERVLLGNGAVQREVLNVVDRDLAHRSRFLPQAVAENVDEDGLEPGAARVRVVERLVRAERVKQALLDEVLRPAI